MASYADNLARLEVLAVGELPLQRELGLWACAALRDHAQVKVSGLPPLLSRELRNGRILAAADAIGAQRNWTAAAMLYDEGKKLQRTWQQIKGIELQPGSVRGELHAAMRWHHLPNSHRTFFELLKKYP